VRLFSCCVALDPHMRIWISFLGPYVHCVPNCFVSVRCEAAYVVSCCGSKKNVTLSTVLVLAVFFILLETKHSVLRSARICTGTGTLWMAHQFKTFPCIVPRASLPALVTAKRLFMLLGEHKCLNGAGIVVGFYKNRYDSRSSRFSTGSGIF
jgi:hypothetical protein